MTLTHHASKHVALAEYFRQRFIRGDDSMRIKVVAHRTVADRNPEDGETVLRISTAVAGNPLAIPFLKSLVVAVGSKAGGDVFTPPAPLS